MLSPDVLPLLRARGRAKSVKITNNQQCKQPKCPSTDGWIYPYEVVYPYNGILFSCEKK